MSSSSVLQNPRSRFSSKYRLLFVSLLLVTVLLGAFYKIVFRGQTFQSAQWVAGVTPTGPYGYPGQTGLNYYTFGGDPPGSGWEIVAEGEKLIQEVERGHAPLWNPNHMFGAPLAHNMQLSAFFPLKALLLISHSVAMWDFYKLILFFIAGLFTFLFLELVELSPWSSLVGSLAFMLSGFLVMHAHFSFMDVQVLLPALLYTVERWHRQPSKRNWAFIALSFGLASLCGYPAPVFLAAVFGVSYGLYRLLESGYQKRLSWSVIAKRLGVLGLAVGLGLAIAALMLLPSADVLAHTDNTRPPGMGFLTINLKFIYAAVMPYVLTHLKTDQYVVWSGWHGAIAVFLALVAIFQRPKPICFFFVLFTVGGYMKLGGIAPANWIAYLPIFNRMIYVRYLHPEIAISVAVLAGFGMERLLKREIKFSRAFLISIFLLGLCTAGLLFHKHFYEEWKIKSGGALRQLVIAWIFLLAFLVSVWIGSRGRFLRWKSESIFGFIAVVLIAFELGSYCMAQRNLRYDPFVRAPYLDFLKKEPSILSHDARVFSFNGILYPPYSSGFDIDDMRWMSAINYPYFHRFINEFVCPSCVDRFVGDEPDEIVFGQEMGLSRYFDLSNIKYVLSINSINFPELLNLPLKIASDGKWEGDNGPSYSTLDIAGVSKGAVVQTPTSTIRYPIQIRDDRAKLKVWIGMDPRTFSPEKGDGMDFLISVGHAEKFKTLFETTLASHSQKTGPRWLDASVDLSSYRGKRIQLKFETLPLKNNSFQSTSWADIRLGKSSLDPARLIKESLEVPKDVTSLSFRYLQGAKFKISAAPYAEKLEFRKYIDPKNNISERKWIPVEVNLGVYRGQLIDLALGTTPGPAGNAAWDWGAWGDPHLEYEQEEKSPLKLVYDNDIKIYENKRALPRAYIVHNAVWAKDDDTAVAEMKSASFNPAEKAVLIGTTAETIPSQSEKTTGHKNVKLQSYNAEKIEIDVHTDSPGYLILSDSFDSRWKAKVDGDNSPVFRANLVFRAISVSKGDHHIVFQYDASLFWVSVLISALATLLALGLIFF